MPAEWSFKDAETRFRDVAEAASSGKPQYIKDGDASGYIVMSLDDFEQLQRENDKQKTFTEFLLSAPQGDWELPSSDLKLRDVNL